MLGAGTGLSSRFIESILLVRIGYLVKILGWQNESGRKEKRRVTAHRTGWVDVAENNGSAQDQYRSAIRLLSR